MAEPSELDVWLHAITLGREFIRYHDDDGWVDTNKATLKRKVVAAYPAGVRLVLDERANSDWLSWEFYGITGNPGPYSMQAPHPDAVKADLDLIDIGQGIPKRRGRGGRRKPPL